MAHIPERPRLANTYRFLTTFLEWQLAFPHINPAWFQLVAIILSLSYWRVPSSWGKVAVIAIILIADWLDGATARQQQLSHRAGYLTDVMVDRASEALIFLADVSTVWGQLFFALWLVNTVLVFYSAHSGKHRSLPLRFAYMLLLPCCF